MRIRRLGVPVGVLMLTLLLAPVAARAAGDDADLRCDGTDEQLFDEMQKNGTLGYGETWDEHTCDQGAEMYAEGATSKWKAMRTPRSRVVSANDQMLALVMPMAAFGGLGAIFLAAAALAAVSRMKKRIILEVPCPSCEASLPIPVDDKSAHQLFCPLCGAACSVEVTGRGKTAKARVLA